MSDGISVPPKRSRTRSVARTVLAVAAAVIAVALVAAAVAAWALLYRAQNPVAAGTPVEVRIAKGSSAAQIGSQLAAQGVVANARMFRWEARNSPYGSKLKPGTYKLATGMPYELVLEKLAKGPEVVYYDVVIPEGFSLNQIAERLSAKAGIDKEEFLRLATTDSAQFAANRPYLQSSEVTSLEGFLFPKTYRIKKGTKPEKVIEMMLAQFDEEIAAVDMTYAKSKNLNVRDVVTIASIIEREARLEKEFPLVASVIYNRLHAKMRLQLCATCLYGLPEGTTSLKTSDLARITPYNTYRRSGLPAGPICSPGLQALDAAAHPAKTEYLYYVLTGKDGSQTFTKDYASFLKAKGKSKTILSGGE